MLKIKRLLYVLIFIVLIYTRFVNLSWGLPYPMHPDERNMANAVQSLTCEVANFNAFDKLSVDHEQSRRIKFQISNCMNPHFFAYGQFPLYLSYFLIQDYHFFSGKVARPITFEEAVMSLRVISAFASVINIFVLVEIIKLILKGKNSELRITNYRLLIALLIFTFSPFFIQFSHFGTTESLLMLFYSLLIYFSVLSLQKKILQSKFLILNSLFLGLAIATKISSLVFIAVPILAQLSSISIWPKKDRLLGIFFLVIKLASLTLLFSIIFSPHNFISFNDFLGSMKYESDVALGIYKAFYTRQFLYTTPIVFQFLKIFPYSLGLPTLIFFILGFFLLPRSKEINLIRLGFLIYFVSEAFFYAKWTRFMAPVLPLMLVLAVLFLFQISINLKSVLPLLLLIVLIIPGIAYLSIYQNADVRITASEWIYKNIPTNSLILSETANVVDIPINKSSYPTGIQPKNFNVISFNFYDLDENQTFQTMLNNYISTADYIFVPSKRIFANHTCLQFQSFTHSINSGLILSNVEGSKFKVKNERCNYLESAFPQLNNYYEKLFSGGLNFKKVAEFSSYPKIGLFGKTLFELPDENAEETWTVFDHPVIRIYRRI